MKRLSVVILLIGAGCANRVYVPVITSEPRDVRVLARLPDEVVWEAVRELRDIGYIVSQKGESSFLLKMDILLLLY